MKAFVAVLSVLASASAQIISPYAGVAGLGYAGAYGVLPYAGAYGAYPYAAGFAPAVVKAADAEVVAAAPVAAAPVAIAAAPVSTSRLIAAPALPQTSQFQSQDEFGNLAYGYANHNSAKQETGNTYGGVTGSYSYTDANGLIQTVNYIADGLGFRVQATNLPVAPVAELAQPVHEYTLPVAPVFEGVAPVHEYTLPEPVQDTPEVAAAKAEHLAAVAEAASREKRSTPAATALLPAAVPAALPYAGFGYAGLGYAGLGYNGYALGAHYIGKRSADSDAEAKPWLAYANYGYAGYPYAGAYGAYPYAYGLGYNGYALGGAHLIGKRSAEAEAKPEAWYGAYGYGAYPYAYGGYGYPYAYGGYYGYGK